MDTKTREKNQHPITLQPQIMKKSLYEAPLTIEIWRGLKNFLHLKKTSESPNTPQFPQVPYTFIHNEFIRIKQRSLF